jgi:hypothetical protein
MAHYHIQPVRVLPINVTRVAMLLAVGAVGGEGARGVNGGWRASWTEVRNYQTGNTRLSWSEEQRAKWEARRSVYNKRKERQRSVVQRRPATGSEDCLQVRAAWLVLF